MTERTVFEKAWNDPETVFLYRNDEHGVGVIVDIHPKVPNQLVVIPNESENASNIGGLDQKMSLKLMAVAAFMIAKLTDSGPDPKTRGIMHIEGFSVPDHPHIVVFSATRGESINLHKSPLDEGRQQQLIGETLANKSIWLTDEEKTELGRILDDIK